MLRIPIGMTDLIILIGPRRSAARRVRTLANDQTPVPRDYSPRLIGNIE